MNKNNINKIAESKDWTNIIEINEGFEKTKKYYFLKNNKKYILKIFSTELLEKKKKEYTILKQIQKVKFLKPKPITIKKISGVEEYYYILTWIEGVTLTKYVKQKNMKELYRIGRKIGDIISEIHKERFDKADLTSKIRKIENKIPKFKEIKINGVKETVDFLEKNYMELIKQPKSIIHGDINPENIIIDDKENIGIIDFGNSDIDYSYQDMHQVQMYTRFLSIEVSAGIIDSYIKMKNINYFWKCYKIYSAYYCLSKIIWSEQFKDSSLREDMIKRAKQTIIDFNYFKNEIPQWYIDYKKRNNEI